MKATYIKSGAMVEIQYVKGGWTTIRFENGDEMKVRNSQLTNINEADKAQATHDAAVRAAIMEDVKATPKSFVTNEQGEACCPKCGSVHLYEGRVESDGAGLGIVVDEDVCGGCHDCDWSFDHRVNTPAGMRRIKKAVYDPRNYVKTKSGNGFNSMDKGDSLALYLRTLTLDEIYEYAADVCDIPMAELVAKYKHLNLGMQRMNLGNRIRNLLKA